MHRVAAALLVAGFLVGTVAGAAGAAGSGVTPQEKAQARQALLVLSEFPKGWTSSPFHSSSTSSIARNVHEARCLGISPTSLEFNPPRVDSPVFFDLASKMTVENAVLVFRSTSFANNEYNALDNPKAPGCLEADAASTGTTLLPRPHLSLEKLSGSRRAVSFGISSSKNGFNSLVVISFFTHQQFGDVVAAGIEAGSASSEANLRSLAQRFLNVAHSRL